MSFGIFTCCLSTANTVMEISNNMRLYAVHVQPLVCGTALVGCGCSIQEEPALTMVIQDQASWAGCRLRPYPMGFNPFCVFGIFLSIILSS